LLFDHRQPFINAVLHFRYVSQEILLTCTHSVDSRINAIGGLWLKQ